MKRSATFFAKLLFAFDLPGRRCRLASEKPLAN
jgi:hypothetical protein